MTTALCYPPARHSARAAELRLLAPEFRLLARDIILVDHQDRRIGKDRVIRGDVYETVSRGIVARFVVDDCGCPTYGYVLNWDEDLLIPTEPVVDRPIARIRDRVRDLSGARDLATLVPPVCPLEVELESFPYPLLLEQLRGVVPSLAVPSPRPAAKIDPGTIVHPRKFERDAWPLREPEMWALISQHCDEPDLAGTLTAEERWLIGLDDQAGRNLHAVLTAGGVARHVYPLPGEAAARISPHPNPYMPPAKYAVVAETAISPSFGRLTFLSIQRT